MVDSRWVLKVAGFGLKVLRTSSPIEDDYAYHRDQLWMAPELLRMPTILRPTYGTQPGDVYSFGIVLQEIMFRTLPFFLGTISPKGLLIECYC
jgi:serine/threonine protein kinase